MKRIGMLVAAALLLLFSFNISCVGDDNTLCGKVKINTVCDAPTCCDGRLWQCDLNNFRYDGISIACEDICAKEEMFFIGTCGEDTKNYFIPQGCCYCQEDDGNEYCISMYFGEFDNMQ